MVPPSREVVKPSHGETALPTSVESQPLTEPGTHQVGGEDGHRSHHRLGHRHREPDFQPRLVSQIKHWVHQERQRRHHLNEHHHVHRQEAKSTSITPSQNIDPLDELERILSKHDLDGEDEEAVPVRPGPGRSKKSSSNRAGLLARLKPRRKSTAGSSTDARDDEVCIPSCDVVLDNTRVAQADPDDTLSSTASRSRSHLEDDEIWKDFKTEILKLTHTLKLRRWGKVDLDRAEELQVKRLSGALTNAVYVVLPPPLTSSAQQPRQQVADEQHTKPILPPP